MKVNENATFTVLGQAECGNVHIRVRTLSTPRACSPGAYHSRLDGKFRELHGIDVSTRSVELARERHPLVTYATFDGGALPYRSSRFDMIFSICVMHHVPPVSWRLFVQELHRALKPGGLALVFEHNPYNPATQYVVRTCDLDKDAVLLRPATLRRLFEAAHRQPFLPSMVTGSPRS